MPEHGVIVDLSVDPYLLDDNPPVVRGIEGIPQGNLDQYIFQPDDPKWDDLVPKSIPSRHRRTTVSCYSWPGVHPKACMRHYGKQLTPLVSCLLKKAMTIFLLRAGSLSARCTGGRSKPGWSKRGQYKLTIGTI